jgi:hypothetical protein
MAKAKTYKGKSLRLGGGGQFAKLKDELISEGKSSSSAEKIAAFVGRKKLGKAKFQKLAAAGRKRKAAKK